MSENQIENKDNSHPDDSRKESYKELKQELKQEKKDAKEERKESRQENKEERKEQKEERKAEKKYNKYQRKIQTFKRKHNVQSDSNENPPDDFPPFDESHLNEGIIMSSESESDNESYDLEKIKPDISFTMYTTDDGKTIV